MGKRARGSLESPVCTRMQVTVVLGFWETVSSSIAVDLGATLRRESGEMRGPKGRKQVSDLSGFVA